MAANQNPQHKNGAPQPKPNAPNPKESSNKEPSQQSKQPIINVDAWNRYYEYMFRGLPSPPTDSAS